LRTFDSDNNKLTETDPLGRTTTFTYGDRGDVLTQTDALGNRTVSTYQTITLGSSAAAGAALAGQATDFTRLKTTTDPLGNTTRGGYDLRGNLVAQTDPLGNTTTIANDSAGNPIVITGPLGDTTYNEYTADGF